MTRAFAGGLAWLLAIGAAALLSGCERPRPDSQQTGYRGTGMVQVTNPRLSDAKLADNVVPAPQPAASQDGPKAGTVYQNVKVLGDLSVGEFTREMLAITQWVAPEQGCAYCHNLQNLADDSLYTKVVSRRMIQMTQHLNADWKVHVGNTGVTCYTCHRGNNVPNNVWFAPQQPNSFGTQGEAIVQNQPSKVVGLTSLPYDPFTPYLLGAEDIRASGTLANQGALQSMQQTERTYGLMMHMSQALGVNCTFCHNTRNFGTWEGSRPQRVQAWHGIRMARDLNTEYMVGLTGAFPPERLGAAGDVAKVSCATCHQGVNKPLYGAPMINDYPALAMVSTTAPASVAAADPPPIVGVDNATLFFGVGSSTLGAEGATALATLASAMKGNAMVRAVVSGYHSAAGDLAQNQELAKQRAFSVRDALKSAGVPEDRVTLQKPQSAATNLPGEDPKARRVDVMIAR